MAYRSANIDNDWWSSIGYQNYQLLGLTHETAFFDVRVLNPFDPNGPKRNTTISTDNILSTWKRKEKKLWAASEKNWSWLIHHFFQLLEWAKLRRLLTNGWPLILLLKTRTIQLNYGLALLQSKFFTPEIRVYMLEGSIIKQILSLALILTLVQAREELYNRSFLCIFISDDRLYYS